LVSVGQAKAAAQALAHRILCVGRRLNGKKQGCSESARCAFGTATRQGRDLDRHGEAESPEKGAASI
jgi:hypothetical protein